MISMKEYTRLPSDNGIFHLMYSNFVTIVDTSTLSTCETFNFGSKQVFWTDWSSLKPELIAVAAGLSTVRMIDIRSGSSAQNITISSSLQTTGHSITSIIWDKMDQDVFFAGDTEGYIHVYDIRNARKSVTKAHDENHVCEPITCLHFTLDKMSLLSFNGYRDRLNLWCLKDKTVKNSDINFQIPHAKRRNAVTAASRVPQASSSSSSSQRISRRHEAVTSKNLSLASLIKPQIFVTEDLIFSPGPSNKSGIDMIINDLSTGSLVKKLSGDVYMPGYNSMSINSVLGLEPDGLIIYTGGYGSFKVWSPPFHSDYDKQMTNTVLNDDWSDDE